MSEEYTDAPFSVEYLKTLHFEYRQTWEEYTDYDAYVGKLRYTLTVVQDDGKPYAYAVLIDTTAKLCDGPELILSLDDAYEILGQTPKETA